MGAVVISRASVGCVRMLFCDATEAMHGATHRCTVHGASAAARGRVRPESQMRF